MKRHFEDELDALKKQLVQMACNVEKAVEAATEALQQNSPDAIRRVDQIERRINLAHKEVDEQCVNLLALQQPLAMDLRLIVAVIKINSDLERMGDQAVNISQNALLYLKGEPVPGLEDDFAAMFREVRLIVHEAIDSFIRNDEALAHTVLRRDDVVDGYKHKIFREVSKR